MHLIEVSCSHRVALNRGKSVQDRIMIRFLATFDDDACGRYAMMVFFNSEVDMKSFENLNAQEHSL